jgi:dTDP-4-amino-4,6-dideoxygalactose transaminase/CelD/BcsL family acetyltransferase involved in cellulose biosynthesis
MTPPRLSLFPALPPMVYARRPSDRLPFPLEEPGCALFGRARHGLCHAVQAFGLERGDEVLTPAYHHGSEVEALLRAGLVCRFYDATETLEPSESELESLLGPQTRALYLIHYFGFPQNAAHWRRWCDERGLLLIEDGAQAWLASFDDAPVGSIGDLAIFCLYKTFGLPDGAAVVSRVTQGQRNASGPAGLERLARRHAAWLTARSRVVGRLTAPLQREHEPSPEREFAWLEEERAPSAAALFLLPRIADRSAAARRRANYRLLLDELAELVPRPFAQLANGASPLVFPIERRDGDPLPVERLEKDGIGAAPFWRVLHPSFPAERFPGAASWRARLIGLPVHQELRVGDVERIATSVRARSRRPRPLHVEPHNDFEALSDEWRRLAEESTNIFATPEWVTTWWRHFGGGRQLLATACRSAAGEVVGILPLYLWTRRPVRILRFLGHGPGDQLGPLCASSDEPRLARALRGAVAEGPLRCDVLLGERLPGDEGWSGLLGARTLLRESTPLIRFHHDSWEAFLRSLSARLRHEIRHDERKLAGEHALGYRLADDPARLQEDMDTLFSLHQARWGGTSALTGAREAFHREFAARALERGWLRLWFLELDGRPVAAWYGFRFGGVDSFYQAGRDLAWQRSSVGLVLMTHTMRTALEQGAQEYRFLRGGEAYKFRFARDDRALETIALARGAAGAAAVAGAFSARAARRGYRRARAMARR